VKNIKALLDKPKTIQNYARGYLDYVSGILKYIDIDAIASFIEELEDARINKNTIFLIGNGGSAVTASHMASDFGVRSSLHENGEPYRILALTDNVAKITAISNDHGYDKIFLYQLKMHYRPGDKLVAISASGNSPNIISAAKWVKNEGGTVVGLVGFDGGKLKDICDILIHAKTPRGEYGPVEDIHMIVNHLVYTWLHRKAVKRGKR